MVKESKLYPVVERWLKKYHRCFKTAINRGKKESRIDVVGIRDTGGNLSGEVETISVEVKRGTEPFATACGQALGYKVYANKVYLADLRDAPFTTDEIGIASHLGIGLIQIRNGICKEVLSSPYYKPITKQNLLLLENLALGKCQLCGYFFDIGSNINGKTNYSNTTKEDIKKALSEFKGIRFWNEEVSKRKEKVGLIKKNEYIYERRFICPDCIDRVISQFKNQNK